jgi:hypothetical protein
MKYFALTMILAVLIIAGIFSQQKAAEVPVAQEPVETPAPSTPEPVRVPPEETTVSPIALVEDSRCPLLVQCIQAGTVRVKARVVTGTTMNEQIFELGKPQSIEGKTITLVSVSPEAKAGTKLVFTDYSFSFSIK